MVFNVGDTTLINGGVGWQPAADPRMTNQLHGGRGLLLLRRLLRRGGRASATHFDSTSPTERDATTANGPVFSRGAASTDFSGSGCAVHGRAWRTRSPVTQQTGNFTHSSPPE